MAWEEHATRADLMAVERRLRAHITEGIERMTDAFSQATSDLDAEISAVADEFKSLVTQVASGSITEQAAHDAIEARVAALKAAVPAPATPPVTPPTAG